MTNSIACLPQATASQGLDTLRRDRGTLQSAMDHVWNMATDLKNIVSTFDRCGRRELTHRQVDDTARKEQIAALNDARSQIATRKNQILESIYDAQSEIAVQAGLRYTDIRQLDNSEVDAGRAQERSLWDDAWKARLAGNSGTEAAVRLRIATNLKDLKTAKGKVREQYRQLNGTGTFMTTNCPQASHDTTPDIRTGDTTSPSTPRAATSATSIHRRVTPPAPQSSNATAARYSQSSTTNPSTRDQAQTELDRLTTQIASINADRWLSPSERLARIRSVCAHPTRADTGPATSLYQDWGQGTSSWAPITA